MLGAPGAGKSTTLRKLAVDLARRAMGDQEAPLSLFVSLGSWVWEEDLAGFLHAHLPEIGWAATALAEQGRLILLLDGLNKVPTNQRKTKAEQIRVYGGVSLTLLRQILPE